MFIVGLTGGIGSGKTVVSNHFKTLGIAVVDADEVSRHVVEPGTVALSKITEHFGKAILNADHTLNRRALRAIIFDNPDEKKWLESLLHPLIGQETFRQLHSSESPYTLFVSPLLIEIGQDKMTHRILVIDAPESAQLARTIIRDNSDEDSVRAIINSQSSREQRLEKADDVILNDGNLDHLKSQVERLHHHYLDLAKEHRT